MVRDTSVGSRVLDVFVYAFLIGLVVITLFPILHILSVSLSKGEAVISGSVSIFPRGFNLSAYKLIFNTDRITRGYANAILYTVLGTSNSLFFTVLMAYALSKKRLLFRGVITTMVVITMFFAGGLVPLFLVVKSLGMYNSILALFIPTTIAAWNLIIMRTFFQSQPAELEESAFLDGANDITVLFRIIIPISKAGIATIGLFYMINYWNSWFPAVIYLKSTDKYPLQVVLRDIIMANQLATEFARAGATSGIGQQGASGGRNLAEFLTMEKIKYATLFASMLPMLIVYPFIQKYFAKGVMIGSLKG